MNLFTINYNFYYLIKDNLGFFTFIFLYLTLCLCLNDHFIEHYCFMNNYGSNNNINTSYQGASFQGNYNFQGGTPNNPQGGIPQGAIPQDNSNNNEDNLNTVTSSNITNNDNSVLPFDTERERQAIRACMRDKLIAHRTECASKQPYSNTLDEKFTSQEHEYICELIMQYKEANPSAPYTYLNKITGMYPDRKYTGAISLSFLETFFGDK